MANIGDKFIIELAVECSNSNNDRCFILKNTKGMQVMVKESTLDGFEKWDEQSAIKQLEEFSKGVSDDIEAAYQRGLNDAWEAARKVYLPENQGGLSIFELNYVFDVRHINTLFTEFNAKEVIEKLHAYEAEKKAKEEEEEEIKVGDEVETTAFNKVIVLKHLHDGYYAALNDKFEKVMIHSSGITKKTGRHFPQVEEMIKIMNDGDSMERLTDRKTAADLKANAEERKNHKEKGRCVDCVYSTFHKWHLFCNKWHVERLLEECCDDFTNERG